MMTYGNRRIRKLIQQLAIEMAEYDLNEIMDQTGSSAREAKDDILNYDYDENAWLGELGGLIAVELLDYYLKAVKKLRV